jgi:hypothetical protein
LSSSDGDYAIADQQGKTLSLESDDRGTSLLNGDSWGRYLGQALSGQGSAQWNLGLGPWTYIKWSPDDGRIEAVQADGKTKGGIYLSRGEGNTLMWSHDPQYWIRWKKVPAVNLFPHVD